MISSNSASLSPVEPQPQTWAQHLAEQRQGLQKHMAALEILESRIRFYGLLDKPVDTFDLWAIKHEIRNQAT